MYILIEQQQQQQNTNTNSSSNNNNNNNSAAAATTGTTATAAATTTTTRSTIAFFPIDAKGRYLFNHRVSPVNDQQAQEKPKINKSTKNKQQKTLSTSFVTLDPCSSPHKRPATHREKVKGKREKEKQKETRQGTPCIYQVPVRPVSQAGTCSLFIPSFFTWKCSLAFGDKVDASFEPRGEKKSKSSNSPCLLAGFGRRQSAERIAFLPNDME